MSELGVFAVDRGVFDHPKLRESKAYTKVQAWIWLCGRAAWKPYTRRVSGKLFQLERGQLVASTRFMAEAWGWDESRVRRFLALLKSDADDDAMIDAVTDAGVTVITVRKYNEYQRVSLPRDAAIDAVSDAENDAVPTQERRKVEDTKNNQVISFGGDFPADAWERFYEAYPHKVGKGAAKRAFGSVMRNRKVSFAELMGGLDRYKRTKPPDISWCNPATFLNQERWADEPAAATPKHQYQSRNPKRDEWIDCQQSAGNYGRSGDPDVESVSQGWPQTGG